MYGVILDNYTRVSCGTGPDVLQVMLLFQRAGYRESLPTFTLAEPVLMR